MDKKPLPDIAAMLGQFISGVPQALQPRFLALPTSPGVYMYKNPDGEILYVGKAINLKNRVRSYFQKNGKTTKIKQMLSQVVDWELILTGSPITAEQAERIGLVNRVVPASELMAEVKTLARRLAAQAPLAMRYILDAVHSGLSMPFAEACRHEATLFGLVAATDDMREGTRAFLEKRQPQFKGR